MDTEIEIIDNNQNNISEKRIKQSRFMYILEAAFEYFIDILVAGAYIAKVTTSIGISDELTGILTSFVTLGSGFQIFALLFIRKKRVKSWVTFGNTINQLSFALIYIIPFFNISKNDKTLLFIIFLLLGNILSKVFFSPKTNWFMSLVDNDKRGRFTATKEIVSLLSGFIFSFIIGRVMDNYEAMGDIKQSFIFCAICIFVLSILHVLTLVFSVEKENTNVNTISLKQQLGSILKQKSIYKIIFLTMLWHVAIGFSTPFYGVYQISELGFSMTFIAILSLLYAVIRSLFEHPLGKFADKRSFVSMLNICYTVALIAFIVNIFTVPSNGKIFYTIYYSLYAIAMAGINSSEINLVYDYVSEENRVGALAIKNTIIGFTGFFSTLLASRLVKYIQANGNSIFGINLYAQQAISFVTAVLIIFTIVYMNLALRKVKTNKNVEE